MKLLGIDFGMTRIGVAVSDPLGITARGLETVVWNGKNWDRPIARIKTLLEQEGAQGIVLGLPKRTDGKLGESEEKAREMALLLEEATGIRPILYDERFTTVLAHQVLRETGFRKSKTRSVIDQVAAEILLQEYLRTQRPESKPL